MSGGELNVFSIEYVLYRMCSLSTLTHIEAGVSGGELGSRVHPHGGQSLGDVRVHVPSRVPSFGRQADLP